MENTPSVQSVSLEHWLHLLPAIVSLDRPYHYWRNEIFCLAETNAVDNAGMIQGI